MWKEEKIGIIKNILILIGILLFAAIIFIIAKTVIDLKRYNKCFIADYDPNYNYDICINYLDY